MSGEQKFDSLTSRVAMPPDSIPIEKQRLKRVENAFSSLPARYIGAPAGYRATVQIRLGDIGRTWEVRLDGDHVSVGSSVSDGPDVVIGTDASTWLALREGRISGLDAFAQRRLYARGDLDAALGFEGRFELPGGRPPLIRIEDVTAERERISSLIAGDGPEHVICIHGLGGTKVSFFETVAALTPRHTVHAIDLPGFGSSSKPVRAPFNAQWFARIVLAYMDRLGIERAHLVGNSMGGRVALEVALGSPDRVSSLGLLTPALAFRRRREFVPLVRLLRPELAAIPHPLRASTVREQFWSLFARPERLDPAAADIAADEFCRIYRSRAARVAFYSSARNIYLDAPWGETGFWTRLAGLEVPALFVWGDQDRLVPAGFSRHVTEVLPSAEQVTLEECGHVPQVELPEQTNALLERLISTAAEGDRALVAERRGCVVSRSRRSSV
ncbi:hypothetical protein BH10ACT11_BH10ACT11_11550 [soil metagenome]